MLRTKPDSVHLLILGAGWTSTFLIPQLRTEGIVHAETTTTGRDGTIPFKFEPEADSVEPYQRLPSANTVLITFPLKGQGQSKRITSLYRRVHGDKNHWIQLGSTGIYNQVPGWNTEDSDYDQSQARAIAEDELRLCAGGCVLNLAGLYGGDRKPAQWLTRIAKSKEEMRAKGAVHFVHGLDVARAIIATHNHFIPGKRWIIADLRVYDWWDLLLSFSATAEGGQRSQYAQWIGELMAEEGVRALPRPDENLGRKLDSRGFWLEMGVWPQHARLS